MKRVGRFLRVFFGVIFAIATVVYIVVAITEPQVRVPMIVVAVLAGAVAVLLLRRKKPQAADQPSAPLPVNASSTLVPDAPEDVLQDMRSAYTVTQAKDDARIMQDCITLVGQTTDLHVFLMRLELGQQKALTLLQAEKAGIKGIRQIGVADKCERFLRTTAEAKSAFLDRSSTKTQVDAMQLKTPAGQRRRMQAYIDKLEAHRLDFMEVEHDFEETIRRTKAVMP